MRKLKEAFFELNHICKSFHTVKAVNDVSFTIGKGEVHAICGENGAGKSTLMNLISGVYRCDSGEMRLDGKPFCPKNPAEARKAGVSIVFQELSMFSQQTTEMNIFAGKELSRFGFLNHKKMRERTQKVLDDMELNIDLSLPVQQLSIGQRQWIEIARAIADDAKVLILDEPNSALNMYETEILFRLIREQTAKGMTILYISHRMDEVFDISDRITVMRDGRYIQTRNTAETDVDEVISLMLGHNAKCLYTRAPSEKGEVVLQVEQLSADGLRDVSFHVRAGEVVGLSGLSGCGYEVLLKVLFGLEHFTSGSITVDGEIIRPNSPLDAMKKHIAMVPSDRRDTGLMTDWSIGRNIAQSVLRLNSRHGLLQHRENRRIAQEYIEKLNVICTDQDSRVIELSGGNQQKVLLAKWLATHPRLLILDDPTRGIDVGAKQEIYQLIDRLTAQGFAVLMTSSEIDELTALSDRILLFRNGEHIKTVDYGTTKGTILKHIAVDTSHSNRTAKKDDTAQEKTCSPLLKKARKVGKAISFQEVGVLMALIAVIAGFSIFVPSFMTAENVAVILKQMSILGILTFGMTFVFSANEVDLSVGMILNATMACVALLMTRTGLNPWVCVGIGMVFATALGAINGLLAVAFDLPTIVITLGTMSIYRGLALVLNDGKTISGLPESSFLDIARYKIFGVSMLAVICLAVFVLCAVFFRHNKLARHLLLAGDNAAAAKKRGINTNALRVGVMTFSGFMCGLAAMLTLSNLTSADTTTGNGYEMSAIGAVVIGGTKMGGGSGTMWGSLIGIALVTVIQNGLVFLGLQSAWRSLFVGVTMIAAIAIDTLVERKAANRLRKS